MKHEQGNGSQTGKMTEAVDLLDFENASLGKVPFLEDGYVINLENSPLEVHPALGQRRHWHIYTIKNYEVIRLVSLSDDSLEKLVKFIDETRND